MLFFRSINWKKKYHGVYYFSNICVYVRKILTFLIPMSITVPCAGSCIDYIKLWRHAWFSLYLVWIHLLKVRLTGNLINKCTYVYQDLYQQNICRQFIDYIVAHGYSNNVVYPIHNNVAYQHLTCIVCI